MQDVLGNTVQQIALVAHHDEACPIEFEEGFEPQRRLEIEMVGWLVEQQQVWLGEQQRRKSDTHAPSAGERGERPMLRRLVEAQAGEDARGPRRGAMRIDGVQSVMDPANAMRIGCRSASSSRRDRSVAAAITVSKGVPLPPGASCT